MATLQSMTGVSAPNVILVSLDAAVDRTVLINQIKDALSNTGSELIVFELDDIVQVNVDFLASTWSTVMLLPLFTLTSAALCLMAYVMLAVDEQRQELAFLRAVGAKPKTVTTIVAIQSAIVLLSSCGFGLSLGTITTLLILMRQPVVTSFNVLEIAL
jgi:ABC-type antimicrobial peptide transport system permease subunit